MKVDFFRVQSVVITFVAFYPVKTDLRIKFQIDCQVGHMVFYGKTVDFHHPVCTYPPGNPLVGDGAVYETVTQYDFPRVKRRKHLFHQMLTPGGRKQKCFCRSEEHTSELQ